MNDRTLLVLGASPHQLDVIAAAQRRGLRVAVADNVPDNPGHRLADVSHVVDTTDAGAIEAVARAEGAAAIVAPCTDVAVPTAAGVAARLGLPGVAPEIAAVTTSKLAFRRWQREIGLPSPETVELTDGAPLPGAGRWLVKPDRSSGSKGIRIVEDAAQLASALATARAFGPDVVIEREVEGHHVTVEALLRAGEPAWAVVLDRQTAKPPWVATTGHRLPTLLTPDDVERTLAAVTATVRALGLREGPLDVDAVVGDEIVVLELSPRLGGNRITGLLELATGVDLADIAVDVGFGRPTPVPPAPVVRPSAVLLLGVEREGRLVYDAAAVEALRAEPWVEQLELQPAGTPARAFVDGRATVGSALLTALSRREIDTRAEELLARLELGAA
jgi:biotin carboxylase